MGCHSSFLQQGQKQFRCDTGAPPTLPASAESQTTPAGSCGTWLCREPGSARDCTSNGQIPPPLPSSLTTRGGEGKIIILTGINERKDKKGG